MHQTSIGMVNYKMTTYTITIVGDENDGDYVTNTFDIDTEDKQYLPTVHNISPEYTVLQFIQVLSGVLTKIKRNNNNWTNNGWEGDVNSNRTCLEVIKVVYNQPALEHVHQDLYDEFFDIISELLPSGENIGIDTIESITLVPKEEIKVLFKR